MPSGQQSLSSLNESFEWTAHEKRLSSAWGGPAAQWFGTVLPRIHEFIPVETILEIAPAEGRWTNSLKDHCENLIVVDVSEERIAACRERFAASTNITYHKNNGRTLEMIDDHSVDFVFSFDSMVHADPVVFESYLRELRRTLKPNGVGIIHHSNLGMYPELAAWSHDGSQGYLEEKGERKDLLAWHSPKMTARHFEQACERAGLQCRSQELVNWLSTHLIACFSLFTQKDSIWARTNKVIENLNFMDEVNRIEGLSEIYSTATEYECFHDVAEGERVAGWAWDKRRPNARVAVDIYDGANLLASVLADKPRSDIIAYTKDDGHHAFVYDLPGRVKDGKAHEISVRVRGTDIRAHGSPRIFTSTPPRKRKPERTKQAMRATRN